MEKIKKSHSYPKAEIKEPYGNKNIAFAIILNIIITAFEIVGGLFIGSLALISEALHNFSDVGSLSLSWWGEKIKMRGNTTLKTYGYKRAEILIAFFNSLILLAVIAFILIEAVQRLFHPSEIAGTSMIWTAILALVGNGIATYLLEKDAHKNLNMKSAWLHSFQDALFSLGIVIGAILIYYFHWYIIDPVISIVLSVYVLKEVYELIMQTINILMESVPEDVDFEEVKARLLSMSGVKEINDLHIWQTDSNSRFLSAHMEIENMENEKRTDLIVEVQKEMFEYFKINHTTVQMVSVTEAEKLKLNCGHCN
ncbi:MAG: cation diffusion facilitator family transporter [Candidatus Moranbacteria bacterium]|nr:cation diffusion facilitator family transporter [Candidatus Moranbacteria bacterium]